MSPQRDAGQYMCNTCQMSTSSSVSGTVLDAKPDQSVQEPSTVLLSTLATVVSTLPVSKPPRLCLLSTIWVNALATTVSLYRVGEKSVYSMSICQEPSTVPLSTSAVVVSRTSNRTLSLQPSLPTRTRSTETLPATRWGYSTMGVLAVKTVEVRPVLMVRAMETIEEVDGFRVRFDDSLSLGDAAVPQSE